MLFALAVILSLVSPPKQAFAQWIDVFAIPVVTQPQQVEIEKVSVKKKHSRRARKSRRHRYRSSSKVPEVSIPVPTPVPIKEPETLSVIIKVPEELIVPLIDRFGVFVEPVFVKPVIYKKPEIPNSGLLLVTIVCLSTVSFLAIMLYVSYRFKYNK